MMKTILILAMVCFWAGCSSEPAKEQTKPITGAPSQASTAAKVEPKVPVTKAEKPRVVADPLNDPSSPLSKRSIYFAYDQADIKNEYKSLLRAHAAYLAAHPGAKATLEGNCDERGSREYNLALGQRRADSVKALLKLLGAREEQLESVSWGEEKPKAPGHDEAAWAENRRCDIRYGKAQ